MDELGCIADIADPERRVLDGHQGVLSGNSQTADVAVGHLRCHDEIFVAVNGAHLHDLLALVLEALQVGDGFAASLHFGGMDVGLVFFGHFYFDVFLFFCHFLFSFFFFFAD